MKINFLKSSLTVFFLIIFIFSEKMNAQDELPAYLEPEIQINYGPENKWSHRFKIGNRELINAGDKSYFQVKFIDLTHFTKYELNARNEIGFGIRYRFREVFEDFKQDEIRIMQQYEHSRTFTNFNLSHEIRVEQRFREINSLRTRYELSFKFPLGNQLENAGTFLTAATDALWSTGKDERPSLEQRFSVELDKELWTNTSGSFGIEYRYDDYTGDPSSEFFILAGLSIDI